MMKNRLMNIEKFFFSSGKEKFGKPLESSLKETTLLFWQIAAPYLLGDFHPASLLSFELLFFLDNELILLFSDEYLADDRIGLLTGMIDF